VKIGLASGETTKTPGAIGALVAAAPGTISVSFFDTFEMTILNVVPSSVVAATAGTARAAAATPPSRAARRRRETWGMSISFLQTCWVERLE